MSRAAAVHGACPTADAFDLPHQSYYFRPRFSGACIAFVQGHPQRLATECALDMKKILTCQQHIREIQNDTKFLCC